MEGLFNPLDKKNLAKSVCTELLSKAATPMGKLPKFEGAGVYAIYYTGNFAPYRFIAQENKDELRLPIYVGKAITAGSRRSVIFGEETSGTSLWKRLIEHAESIKCSSTLKIEDFSCRYLVVDPVWIPLGENLLINELRPLWNCSLDGFGNHDPGNGRYAQQISPWDILHPGRTWAAKCAPNKKKDHGSILKEIGDFFKGHPGKDSTLTQVKIVKS